MEWISVILLVMVLSQPVEVIFSEINIESTFFPLKRHTSNDPLKWLRVVFYQQTVPKKFQFPGLLQQNGEEHLCAFRLMMGKHIVKKKSEKLCGVGVVGRRWITKFFPPTIPLCILFSVTADRMLSSLSALLALEISWKVVKSSQGKPTTSYVDHMRARWSKLIMMQVRIWSILLRKWTIPFITLRTCNYSSQHEVLFFYSEHVELCGFFVC